MLVAGLRCGKGQRRLLQVARSCAYEAWGSFLCYGFDLEGLGQVVYLPLVLLVVVIELID